MRGLLLLSAPMARIDRCHVALTEDRRRAANPPDDDSSSSASHCTDRLTLLVAGDASASSRAASSNTVSRLCETDSCRTLWAPSVTDGRDSRVAVVSTSDDCPSVSSSDESSKPLLEDDGEDSLAESPPEATSPPASSSLYWAWRRCLPLARRPALRNARCTAALHCCTVMLLPLSWWSLSQITVKSVQASVADMWQPMKISLSSSKVKE
mmetsp:Transcript_63630/g.136769  ORF Transcript_63630/g.136769 Transcript_63630/m.136769 type:complete len:210 (-) Transcript_63630:38-667(-)